MSPWNWNPGGGRGTARCGVVELGVAPLVAPWLSVLVLLLMFYLIGGTFSVAKGVIFELPKAGLSEGEATGPVAVVMPKGKDTLVFFDDARYFAGDEGSLAAFAEHLSERIRRSDRRTLLMLADRRVAGGDLMRLATIARQGGVEKVLFAEKRNAE